MRVTKSTRQNIIAFIKCEKTCWSGRLDQSDFLSRIFDLDKLPSKDNRMANAKADIQQHCINFDDWGPYWIFDDERFNLLGCDDATFLKFLCEMLHPTVRPDLTEVEKLQQEFNKYLREVGFEISKSKQASGHYHVIDRNQVPSLAYLRETLQGTNSESIDRKINLIDSAISRGDVDLAIGTAKDLVEGCCKTILEERDIELSKSEKFIDLVKRTTKELNLAPEHIPEQIKAKENIKRILNNLATIAQGIAELRNHYGTGHGRSAYAKGLQLRHAKLVAGAASTLALFLMDTHKERPL